MRQFLYGLLSRGAEPVLRTHRVDSGGAGRGVGQQSGKARGLPTTDAQEPSSGLSGTLEAEDDDCDDTHASLEPDEWGPTEGTAADWATPVAAAPSDVHPGCTTTPGTKSGHVTEDGPNALPAESLTSSPIPDFRPSSAQPNFPNRHLTDDEQGTFSKFPEVKGDGALPAAPDLWLVQGTDQANDSTADHEPTSTLADFNRRSADAYDAAMNAAYDNPSSGLDLAAQ